MATRYVSGKTTTMPNNGTGSGRHGYLISWRRDQNHGLGYQRSFAGYVSRSPWICQEGRDGHETDGCPSPRGFLKREIYATPRGAFRAIEVVEPYVHLPLSCTSMLKWYPQLSRAVIYTLNTPESNASRFCQPPMLGTLPVEMMDVYRHPLGSCRSLMAALRRMTK
jgi:hypothetical protein